tara:strand:+ start:13255 stop:13404 length:150 start_codon:yes stop_codon:yes gene_type:complete
MASGALPDALDIQHCPHFSGHAKRQCEPAPAHPIITKVNYFIDKASHII